MDRDGIDDPNAKLPLDGVKRGETFAIAEHGQAITVLGPFRARSALIVVQAFSSLRAFRRVHSVGTASIRELVEDRRRASD